MGEGSTAERKAGLGSNASFFPSPALPFRLSAAPPCPRSLSGSPARLHAGAEHMAQLTSAGLPAREGAGGRARVRGGGRPRRSPLPLPPPGRPAEPRHLHRPRSSVFRPGARSALPPGAVSAPAGEKGVEWPRRLHPARSAWAGTRTRPESLSLSVGWGLPRAWLLGDGGAPVRPPPPIPE